METEKWKKVAVGIAFGFIFVMLVIFAVLIVMREAKREEQESTTNEAYILQTDWWA